MKNLMALLMAVSILLLVSSVANALTSSVEPDDYAVGTDISNVFTGVTLSAVGPGWDGVTGPEVYAIDSASQAEAFTASTGSLVFGHSGMFPHLWRESGLLQLRADFAAPAISVSLDFIGNNSSDYGELLAYDSGNTLIDSAYTAQLSTNSVETLTVDGPGIAYVIAGGTSGASSLGMDNMEFDITIEVGGTVEPVELSELGAASDAPAGDNTSHGLIALWVGLASAFAIGGGVFVLRRQRAN